METQGAVAHLGDREAAAADRIARLKDIVIAKEAERAAMASQLAEAKAAQRADLDSLIAAFEASQIEWTTQKDDLKREQRALQQERDAVKTELASLTASAAKVQAEATGALAKLAAADREKAKLKSSLDTRETQRNALVKSLTTTEAARAGDIAGLCAALEASRAENIGTPDQTLDLLRQLGRDRSAAVALLSEPTTTLAEVLARIAGLDARAAEARNAALARHEARCQEQWAELQALRGTAATLTAERDRLRSERDGLAEHARQADRQIDLMRHSTSWKITGPMRRLVRLLRGR